MKVIHGSQRMRLRFLVGLCAAIVPTLAFPAWQIVSAEPGKRIEIDRTSIKRDENGKSLVLGRIVLEKPITDTKTSAAYRIIEALNRYDCAARTYSTVKRSYFKEEGDLLRAEEPKGVVEMPVRSGSLDDKLLREACRPKSGAESVAAASKTAEKVNEAAAELRQANEQMIQKAAKRETPPPAPPVPKPDPVTKPVATTAPVPAPTVTATRPRVARSHAAPERERRADADSHAHAKIHWSYEGEGGPERWGALKAEYSVCASGQRQSPIDISDGIGVDLEPIRFNYRPSQFRIVDNGHTVQVAVGGSSIMLLGKVYDLVQFHFHRPSEERVNGKAFDMVAHLVHKAEDGKLAVVAVLLEKGQENALIQTLWNNLPLEKNEEVTPPAVSIDLAQLLPENRNYYTYMGSLTTPPCSEGVLWLVLKQPKQLSAEQLGIFARLYKNNARPIQPGFSRIIKESR